MFGDAIKAVAKPTLAKLLFATIFLAAKRPFRRGEAHRLPKKCAFLSGETGEVKADGSKNKAAAEPLRSRTNGNEIAAYKSGN